MLYLTNSGVETFKGTSPELESELPVVGRTYALLLRLHEESCIQVGKRAPDTFPAGYYLYLGNAMRGLAARIRRHLVKNKHLYWHIDYLMEVANPVPVWWKMGEERLECMWVCSTQPLPGSQIPAKGFGSSDCNCTRHLVQLSDSEAEDTFYRMTLASRHSCIA